jgi:hypothetical protein
VSGSMSDLISKKTKKRLEGVVGLGKVVVERNPIAHTVLAAKETADSAHKLLYGEDPRYVASSIPRRFRASPNRYRPTPKRKIVYVRKDAALERLLEEDPLKRMYRQTRDPQLKRELRRLMA